MSPRSSARGGSSSPGRGAARGWRWQKGKVKGMRDEKDMRDPSVRPPFWQHRYYYLGLKIIVLIAGVLIALKVIGLW